MFELILCLWSLLKSGKHISNNLDVYRNSTVCQSLVQWSVSLASAASPPSPQSPPPLSCCCQPTTWVSVCWWDITNSSSMSNESFYCQDLNSCWVQCRISFFAHYTPPINLINPPPPAKPPNPTIDNRPTEKGLETRNFFAISHSGARYGHVI